MGPLELEFTVECSAEHAFEMWVSKTASWWPRDHTRSGDPQVTVGFEPRSGGRIYERTSDGVEYDWGEVLVWEPPHRLAYLWHIAGDKDEATEFAISFSPAGDATSVRIVQTGWERLGRRGAELREKNRRGWDGLIPHYRRACLG
jgi:uncharacterized protein YndB with AHSA1/START domain